LFHFTEATSGLVSGMYNGRQSQVIYGIFSTPENSLSASAICAYQLQDIVDTFNGPFKGQENSNSNWLPVPMTKVPELHLGQCSNNSLDLPESTINFIKDHSLMDKAVNPLWGAPVLIHTSFNFKYTKIAVDPQVLAMYGKTFDVLFIGTNRGQVIKAINSASNAMNGHHYHNKVVPVIIEEMIIFADGSPVTNLLLYNNPRHQPKLIVSSATEIKSIPLSQCEKRAKTCSECVALQDPYCVWDISASTCTKFSSYKYQYYLQNIEEGWSPTCPEGRPPSVENPDHKPNGVSRTLEKEAEYAQTFTGETLAFSIVTSVVTSLVVGFIIGYIFSKRCKKDDPNSFSYTDPAGYLDRRNYHQHRLPQDNYSSLGQPPLTKPINLVLNVPPNNRKNANSSADNKPIQKVKKIYL
jgi:semaphorin-1A, putative (fragment)